jgi:hypothetical protein
MIKKVNPRVGLYEALHVTADLLTPDRINIVRLFLGHKYNLPIDISDKRAQFRVQGFLFIVSAGAYLVKDRKSLELKVYSAEEYGRLFYDYEEPVRDRYVFSTVPKPGEDVAVICPSCNMFTASNDGRPAPHDCKPPAEFGMGDFLELCRAARILIFESDSSMILYSTDVTVPYKRLPGGIWIQDLARNFNPIDWRQEALDILKARTGLTSLP